MPERKLFNSSSGIPAMENGFIVFNVESARVFSIDRGDCPQSPAAVDLTALRYNRVRFGS